MDPEFVCREGANGLSEGVDGFGIGFLFFAVRTSEYRLLRGGRRAAP